MAKDNTTVEHPKEVIPIIDDLGYVIEEELATVLFLMDKLKKPILLEGDPGVGKTQVAYILSQWKNCELIRLQCYEGLDVNQAIYEWNYQKQLLAIKIEEGGVKTSREKEELIFSSEFLLRRPLLQAITGKNRKILLIDELDRADEEFEAFLLELLSDFQISIPEIGTIKAEQIPIVVITSNRTRELSDALKRRCLYHWLDYPDQEKETRILKKHIPELENKLAVSISEYVQRMRRLKLDKTPGVAETIDWAKGIQLMSNTDDAFEKTLSCILKSDSDIKLVRESMFN